MSKKDDKKNENKTGKALKYMMTTACVIFVLLLASIVFNICARRMHEKAEWDGSYGDSQNDYGGRNALGYAQAPLIAGSLFGFIIAITMLTSIWYVVHARKAYGPRHSKKAMASFFLLLLSMFSVCLTLFVYEKGDLLVGLFPALPAIFLALSLYYSTYELGGKRYGTIGVVATVLFAIPLMFICHTRSYDVYEVTADWMRFNQRIMLAQIGLLIATGFFMASIKNAKIFTKKFPATLDDPKPSFFERKPRPAIRWKRSAGKKVITAVVVVLVILSAFGIYWCAIRVPGIEEFMKGSYSDGEKASFRAKVSEVEAMETSYGTATLVTFKDFHLPFCFLGDKTAKYREGKTVTTMVQFHEYNVDGVERVLLEELLLGTHLIVEEVFSDISHMAGMYLEGGIPDNDTGSFDIMVRSANHANQTFPFALYDTSINEIGDVETKYEIAISDPYHYETNPKFFYKKGTLLYDHIDLMGMEWEALIDLPSSGYDCARLKSLESFLPDRITETDSNMDGNLGPGDGFNIELEATANEFTFNYYVFNLAGISGGLNIILNWYEGPFHSMDRFTYYTSGPVDEGYVESENVHTFPIADQTGEPIELSKISVTLSHFSPYEGGDFSTVTKKAPFEDNCSLEIYQTYYTTYEITLSYHDFNQNDLLDSGDYFTIRNLQNNSDYEFWIRNSDHDIIIRWDFVVGIGEDISYYPLLTMKSPVKMGDNISIEVESIEANYPKLISEYGHLKFNLTVPGRDINILLDPHDDGLAKNSTDDSIRLEVIDSDENEYLTANDRVVIHGLDAGLDYNLKIHYRWDKAVIYEYDGVA